MITFQKFNKQFIHELKKIWNQAIMDDLVLPTQYPFTTEEFYSYLNKQTASYYMSVNDQIVGLYILHPNIEGRGSHIANASYVIGGKFRGNGFGEILVSHSLEKARENGFSAMQYNAVLATNISAMKIYKKLGFIVIGTIPSGYKINNTVYVDTKIMYLGL